MIEAKDMYKIYKEVDELKQKIDALRDENDALRQANEELLEMLVLASLRAGYDYDSKEYKQIVSLVGQKYIILAKIKHGHALTDKEKEYLTNNLK